MVTIREWVRESTLTKYDMKELLLKARVNVIKDGKQSDDWSIGVDEGFSEIFSQNTVIELTNDAKKHHNIYDIECCRMTIKTENYVRDYKFIPSFYAYCIGSKIEEEYGAKLYVDPKVDKYLEKKFLSMWDLIRNYGNFSRDHMDELKAIAYNYFNWDTEIINHYDEISERDYKKAKKLEELKA